MTMVECRIEVNVKCRIGLGSGPQLSGNSIDATPLERLTNKLNIVKWLH